MMFGLSSERFSSMSHEDIGDHYVHRLAPPEHHSLAAVRGIEHRVARLLQHFPQELADQ
jgi:hypothetical protein